MTAVDEAAAPSPVLAAREENRVLSDQWRALRRSATFVAVLTAPVAFVWLWKHTGLNLGWAIALTALAVFAFRGAMDLLFRKFIPWPSLFATDDIGLREDDVVNRRRAWYWRQKYRLAAWIVLLLIAIWFIGFIFGHHLTPWGIAIDAGHGVGRLANPRYLPLLIQLPLLFLFNFLIFMGPMLAMGISQIRGFEPGDA